MRRNIWIVSDWHIGHSKIIGYCNRPFKDEKEQTETLIKNHNKLVRPEDIVYVLGDIGFKGQLKETVPRFLGHKIMLIGNHDQESLNFYLECGFAAVLKGATINIGHEMLTLSHYPSRNKIRLISLFLRYTWKMIRKGRDAKLIWQRLKREYRMYFTSGNLYHLHGHTHSPIQVDGRNINCCVEANNYYPTSGNQIIDIINKKRSKNENKSNNTK